MDFVAAWLSDTFVVMVITTQGVLNETQRRRQMVRFRNVRPGQRPLDQRLPLFTNRLLPPSRCDWL